MGVAIRNGFDNHLPRVKAMQEVSVPDHDHLADLLDYIRDHQDPQGTSPTLSPITPTQTSGPMQLRFEAFHRANPHVLDAVIEVALGLRRAGLEKCSVWMVFNRLRWIYTIATKGDEFRLNNNYTSYYARLAMLVEPRLDGFFETRKQKDPWAPNWAAMGLTPPAGPRA